MNRINTLLGAAAAVVMLSLPAGAEEASVAMGAKLFSDPGLGASKNDKSCNTCHKNGSGLEKVGNDPRLATVINQCIAGPMEGEKLNEQTVAMQSLILYIKSLDKK